MAFSPHRDRSATSYLVLCASSTRGRKHCIRIWGVPSANKPLIAGPQGYCVDSTPVRLVNNWANGLADRTEACANVLARDNDGPLEGLIEAHVVIVTCIFIRPIHTWCNTACCWRNYNTHTRGKRWLRQKLIFLRLTESVRVTNGRFSADLTLPTEMRESYWSNIFWRPNTRLFVDVHLLMILTERVTNCGS